MKSTKWSPTFAYHILALSTLVKLIDSIDSHQDLNSTNSVEHMGIMAGSSTEATRLLLAGQDEINSLVSRKSIGSSHEMKSGQTPIQAIDSQMLRQPVFQLILTLWGRQSISRNKRIRPVNARYLDSGCI